MILGSRLLYMTYFCREQVPFSQVKLDSLDLGFLVDDCFFGVAPTFNEKNFFLRFARLLLIAGNR